MLDMCYAKKILLGLAQAYGAKGIDESTMHRLAVCPMPDINDRDFARKYVSYNLLRKWDQLETGIDTRAAAQAAFDEAESICHYVNKTRGTTYTSNRHKKRVGERVIFYAIRKIGSMFSSTCLADLVADCDHSGGASLQRPRRSSSVYNKWNDRNNLTRDALGYWLAFTEGTALNKSVTFVASGRGSFVPKDAKTDRPIGIEPQGNMLLQKGVGSYIRRRLRTVGINLQDQSINQNLCTDLANATIDMKSASDRIALSTVKLLLQQAPVLLDAILALRTPNLTFDNRTYLLQKCSGMGNGFTFELESLIFYALTWASCRVAHEDGITVTGTVSVYGDDIIVPANAAPYLTMTLKYLGMSINGSKSYTSGPFRESCGKHVWNGIDCTPMYIKNSRFDNPGDWYHLFNSLNELLGRVYSARAHNILKGLYRKMEREKLLNFVPPTYSIRSGIRASFDVARPHVVRRRRRPQHDDVTTNAYVEVNGDYAVSQQGFYIAHLYRLRNVNAQAPYLTVAGERICANDDAVSRPPGRYATESFTRKELFQKRRVHLAAWDECYSCFWEL